MRAVYDLSRYLTSFNFFEWLVQAKGLGADTVVFDARNIKNKKWPPKIIRRRFESICLPGPSLAGLPHEIVWRSDKSEVGIDIAKPGGGELVSFFKKRGYIDRLKSPLPPKNERYTITLRKTQRSPTRDSNVGAWEEFSEEIGARIIPDYDEVPIHLHERMALYAGAEMNFFVSNGPGVLCSLTEYPCMMFCTHHAAGSFASDGIQGWGAQYPWMIKNQRAIWEEDTLENIRKHFRHWLENGEFLDNPQEPATA